MKSTIYRRIENIFAEQHVMKSYSSVGNCIFCFWKLSALVISSNATSLKQIRKVRFCGSLALVDVNGLIA